MFGIDAPELLVIAMIALIFVGPKELPGMLRALGKWVATARNMAGEFRGHVDDMMRQAELDELKKQVESGARDAVLDLQGLDPTREIKAAIEDGASEADKEMKSAQTAIDTATAEALPAPAPEPAEFVAQSGEAPVPPSDGAVAALPEPAAVPAPDSGAPDTGANGSVADAAPVSAEPEVKPPANETREAPQKVAVG
jgi:sec-independent protein translocase protein TatB